MNSDSHMVVFLSSLFIHEFVTSNTGSFKLLNTIVLFRLRQDEHKLVNRHTWPFWHQHRKFSILGLVHLYYILTLAKVYHYNIYNTY